MKNDRITSRLNDAFERCRLQHDFTGGPFLPFIWVTADRAEQVHHGTTDYALAAWLGWRLAYSGTMVRARGVVDYLVPDLAGDRVVAGHAVLLDTDRGDTLAITGCTWGYGGEGPHGTAIVLADAGFFPDLASALEFVVRLDGSAGWERARE